MGILWWLGRTLHSPVSSGTGGRDAGLESCPSPWGCWPCPACVWGCLFEFQADAFCQVCCWQRRLCRELRRVFLGAAHDREPPCAAQSGLCPQPQRDNVLLSLLPREWGDTGAGMVSTGVWIAACLSFPGREGNLQGIGPRRNGITGKAVTLLSKYNGVKGCGAVCAPRDLLSGGGIH